MVDHSYRLLVCGCRNWKDYESIRRRISELNPTLVIHGGARGADTLAGKAAEELGIAVLVFPADWSRHGRSAGPIRNQQMLYEGQPDYVLAFHDHIDLSKGTAHMIRISKSAGIPTELRRHN